MALVKRNASTGVDPWRREWPIAHSLERLQRDMNRLLGGYFREDVWDRDVSTVGEWIPPIDVSETKDSYVMKAELPGVGKEDIRIALSNNVITIHGEKKSGGGKEDAGYRRIERHFGSFERSCTLPGSVKSNQIDARFSDGVLTITVPKTEEARERVIDVKLK